MDKILQINVLQNFSPQALYVAIRHGSVTFGLDNIWQFLKLSDLVTYSGENFNFNPCFVAVMKSTILNQWNKCIGWDVSTDKIFVTPTCDQFILTQSNRSKHVTTGNCLIPESQALKRQIDAHNRLWRTKCHISVYQESTDETCNDRILCPSLWWHCGPLSWNPPPLCYSFWLQQLFYYRLEIYISIKYKRNKKIGSYYSGLSHWS